ncbi:MAG: hypothetical protein GX173_05460 [Ruminococcaceae bacterium]|jgi:hypothetical protein|nr:hypothetical protein [Oscillospiraceae bacterium]
MKTDCELISIIRQNKTELTHLIKNAHTISLQDEHPGENCSVVAIGRQDGQIVHMTLNADERRDDLYILAAYPHVNPIEAVVLYADEKAAILFNWCLEQGGMPPEQDEEEADVAYLARLVSWIKTNTLASAGEVLTDLIREQLLSDFDAEAELQETLDELHDHARGIVRLPPVDEDEGRDGTARTEPEHLAVPQDLIKLTRLEEKDGTDQKETES